MRPLVTSVSISIAAFALSLPPVVARAGDAPDLQAGRKTFETVCAACHGATGKPDLSSPTVQALDPKPADLSDPLFNSREPARDWDIVVTHGGTALGLSAVMPAQGSTLNEKEIRDVVAYAKTLAPGSDRYPPGELNFFLPVRTKKAFPEDEVVWKYRYSEQDGTNVYRNVIELEKRFGKRSMGVLEVIQQDDGIDNEITEVEVGAKTVLYWNLPERSILSGALVVAIPTDSDASEEIIPYLAYGWRFDDKACSRACASSCRLRTRVTARSNWPVSCTTCGRSGHARSSRPWKRPPRSRSTRATTIRCSGRCCRRSGSGSRRVVTCSGISPTAASSRAGRRQRVRR